MTDADLTRRYTRAALSHTAPAFSMAGLTPRTLQPTAITVHRSSRMLEVGFENGAVFRIPFELMRVCSPSAEVQGHGPGEEVLQTGKRDVVVEAVDPVGHYAIQPRFSDGHSSGIYSWEYLYFLGSQQAELWTEYEAKLIAAGLDRDAVALGKSPTGCGHSH